MIRAFLTGVRCGYSLELFGIFDFNDDGWRKFCRCHAADSFLIIMCGSHVVSRRAGCRAEFINKIFVLRRHDCRKNGVNCFG